VIHFNFQLREKESNLDEIFVKKFCIKNKIIFYIKRFNTYSYIFYKKTSKQIAARKLRYNFLNFFLKKKKYKFVAIAHHIDDSLETFFINFIRGTKIKGIVKKRNKIIRPLISFKKKEIIHFALKNNIFWREDISNKDNKYLRNIIRNNFLSLIKNININFYRNFKKILNFLLLEEEILKNKIKNISYKITIKKQKTPFYWQVNYKSISKKKYIPFYIYRIFYPFGFKKIKTIINILKAQSGKKVFSKKFFLLKDRNSLILSLRNIKNKKIYHIPNIKTIIYFPVKIFFSLKKENYKKKYISVDLDKIQWPLYLRTWRYGDFFFPLGMKGKKKKISKYFKDEKFSFIEKEKIWLLINGNGDIIYLINKRLDERFKISKNTKKSLYIFF
jgi:tRNA(Ile)-lysidine synthase